MSAEEPQKPQYYRLSDGIQVLPNNRIINWKKGVLNQLSNIGTYYLEWVDHPAKNNIKIRMFDADILESMSFTKWWVVPGLYIPWSLLELMKSVYDYDTYESEASQVALYLTNGNFLALCLFSVFIFVMAILGWTIFEYFCHRMLFHLQPPKHATLPLLVAHFLGHGLHHVTPTDADRLVFPPAISFPLAIVFRKFFYYFLFPYGIGAAYFGGFIFGYACYESTHYLCHHSAVDKYPIVHYLFGNFLANRNKYHSQHHYCEAKYDKLYGVTSQIWDVVFGTM